MDIDADVAWAAGFFDGEGTTYRTVVPANKKWRKGVTVARGCLGQNDPEVLEKFKRIMGGKIYGPYFSKDREGIQTHAGE